MTNRLRLLTLLAAFVCTVIGCVWGMLVAAAAVGLVVVAAAATLLASAWWCQWRDDQLAENLAPYLRSSVADEAHQWLDERG